MSVRAITWAWDVPDLGTSERLTLVALADHAAPHGDNPQHQCWPSQETLSQRVCVSERQVRRILDSLEGRGLIKRERRSSKEGRLSDRYWLPVWDEQPDNMSGSPTGHPRPSNRTPMSQQPDTDVQGTVREPKENPQSPGDFDAWWAMWPNKKAKGDARRAWQAAVRKVAGDVIIEDTRRRMHWLRKEHERGYCPYPATWLRGERWSDEVASSAPQPDAVDGLFYAEGL